MKAERQRIDAFQLWWDALRQQGDQTRSKLNEINPEYSLKDWCWIWSSNTLATWCKEPTHQKRLWCWERLKTGGEGDNKRWDGWMAWPTWWTWVWASSESWWWTGRPGVVQSMGLQRVRHDWVTELNWEHTTLFDGYKMSIKLGYGEVFWALVDWCS